MKYWIVLLIPALLLGCVPMRTKNTLERAYELDPKGSLFVSPILRSNPPRKVAILPFRSAVGAGRIEGSRALFNVFNGHENSTVKLAARMRDAFYGQFAQLEFDEMKITRVDRILSENGLDSWEQVRSLTAQKLGKLLGVDALVFGEVTHFDYYYGVLYAQLAAGLSLEMVDARDGELLWHAKDARRDHSFRIALDPIGLTVGVFQVGLHMRPISMMRAMDEACRELVGTIPPPHFPLEKS